MTALIQTGRGLWIVELVLLIFLQLLALLQRPPPDHFGDVLTGPEHGERGATLTVMVSVG